MNQDKNIKIKMIHFDDNNTRIKPIICIPDLLSVCPRQNQRNNFEIGETGVKDTGNNTTNTTTTTITNTITNNNNK